jgi:hypothetical protein
MGFKVYLDSKFEPVPPDQATLIKVIKDNGVVEFWKPPNVTKANPNHDERGRFASGGGGRENESVYESLSQSEKNALAKYKGEDHEYINANLRNEGTLSEDEDYDYEGITNSIDSVIQKSRLQDDLTVYRGMDNDILGDENSVGTVFSDMGFVSTSADKGIASKFESGLIATINLKRGQNAFNLDSVKGGQKELETLLPRGLKFKVVKDNFGSSGVREVTLELKK